LVSTVETPRLKYLPFFAGLKNVLNPDDVDTFADEAIALLESSDDRLVKALSPTKTASSCQTARSTG
jgi:hypothetical protein